MKHKFLVAASSAIIPFISAMCFAENTLSVEASSASAYWEGANASGAIVKEENCPVVLEKERINLNISSLPREGKVELTSYTSEAVAEYTFYNPENRAVDMTLLFPFGVFPSYMQKGAADEISTVSVDGEAVKCRVRYTYASSAFDAETDAARVLDEKKTDAFYREDTSVREYRFTLSKPDAVADTLKIKLAYNPKKTRVIFPSQGTRLCVADGDMYAYTPMSGTRNKSAVFYAVGEAPAEVTPNLYEVVEAGAVLSEPVVREMTFSEFALSSWRADLGVGEIDWYNAVVDMLNDKRGSGGSVDCFSLKSKDLMRWYEYNVKVPAGQRVVSRVKSPLYPTVDGSKNPRYEYSYLLSPAAKWADFGQLEICIETPYLLSNGSLEFTKEEKADGEGYTYLFTRSSLPQGELTFVLTENDAADSDFSVYDNSFLRPSTTWAFVTLTVLASVAALVTIIAVVTLRKKNQ